MTFSSWHLSCTVLFATLFVGEFLCPAFFAQIPHIEIVMLTAASLWCMETTLSKGSKAAGLLQKEERRVSKKDASQSSPSMPLKQEVTMKAITPKQLTLPENTLSFERNVMGYLLQQLERTHFQSDYFSLQDMMQLAHKPEDYLRLELWPVVTFPQQKLLRYKVRTYIPVAGEYRLLPQLSGVADLLISLVTMHRLRQHSETPFMMDFPVTALDYPKVVQHLFDCLDKKDSGFHKVLWLTSDLHNERHRLIWQRLKELGLNFAECLSFPQAKIASPYAHMTWDVFMKHFETEQQRKTAISMDELVSQNTHIILGDVPENATLTTAFDSLYGSFVGSPIILGGDENMRRFA